VPADLPRVRVDGTAVGQVARDGKPRLVADTRASDQMRFGHASHDGIRSTASVPVRVGGRMVGVFNVGSKHVGACHPAMLARVEAVAAIVGPAVFAAEQAHRLLAEPVANGDTAPIDPASWLTRDEAEIQYVVKVLQYTSGRIEGPSGAAKVLGMLPSTLRSRMQKLGLDAKVARKAERGRKP
jgi:transcriptional regulator with GAF, ATPase, and Fis domain